MPHLRTILALFAVATFIAAGVAGELHGPSVALRSLSGRETDLEVDAAIPIDGALALVDESDRMAARVESLFGAYFTRRPRIAVFATPEHFAAGAAALFGYTPDGSERLAATYGGMFDRRSSRIALGVGASDDATMAIIEHELVHQMVRELTHGADLPAWFEEGIATTVAQDDAAGAWVDEETLEGEAIASSGRVSFADIATLDGWQAIYPSVGEALYDYAANAVREMERRVGWTGVVRLVTDTAPNEPFADAYERDAYETLPTLEHRLETSTAATIIVRNKPGADDDILWTLYTGIPNAETEVTIFGGRSYRVTFTVTTDALGMYRGTFGSTAERGEYVVRAAGVYAVLDTDH